VLIYFIGYIDLSKKRVPADGIKECEERVARGKKVHSILRAVAEKLRIDVERLYEGIAWPLSKKIGNSFEAFRQALM
jgi:translation initiation factor 2 subunit 1